MFLLLFLIFLALGVCIYFFLSRSFSPVPYFPSNRKDLAMILKALALKNNHTVYDLGAGDGLVVFAAAEESFRRKLNTRFIAVEKNPVLVFFMWLQWLFHPNKKNISIIRADIFIYRFPILRSKLHAPGYTIYAYVSPWHLEKLYKNIARQLQSFYWISYFYPIPKRKASRTMKGIHSLYIYKR